MMGDDIDLLVIGAGVAGLTAAATAAERGLRTMVAEHLAPGGQIATVDHIDNAPGHPQGIAGYDLGPQLQQQAEQAGAAFLFDTIERVERGAGGFVVTGAAGVVRARAIVMAAGSRRRALGVPGEDALLGRGVSHCASCDGMFFRGRDVIVVGGGDSAFDEARQLANHAASVTLVHPGTAPTARPGVVDQVRARDNVRILADRTVTAIEGDAEVTAARLSDGATMMTAAVFIYAGQTPNSACVADLLDLDEDGRIVTGADLQSGCSGLFAAGDIRAGSGGLIATAMGEGAAAALAAVRYLAGWSE